MHDMFMDILGMGLNRMLNFCDPKVVWGPFAFFYHNSGEKKDHE